MSAAFWGVLLFGACLTCLALAAEDFQKNGAMGAIGYFMGAFGACVGILYVCHRLCCWVIDGFFKTT